MDLYDEGRLFVDTQVDWNAIKIEYVTDSSASYKSLSEKYGITERTVERHASKEGWVALRRDFIGDVSTKTLELEMKKRAQQAVKVGRIADKLLKKLSKAVDELDITLVQDVQKTKTIEYNNDKRPDKPTKEIVDEKVTIGQVSSIVDRNGLKAITSALADVQKILGIKSELDEREQKARITAFEQKAGINGDDEDGGGGVIVLSDVDEPPEEVDDGE
jgi:hypothetical protein